VQFGVGLEGVVQGDEERRLAHSLQHLPLRLGVLGRLFLLDDRRLLQYFHGVQAAAVLAANLTN
jgi:hypothetical protein